MSIDRWMDTEIVVLLYTIEYYSAIKKKECIWVSLNEVDEPRACYTEWSKLERERQNCALTHHTESRKMVLTNLFSGQQWRCRHENSLVDTVGEGEGGTNWEKHGNIHITVCRIDIFYIK